MKQAAVIGAGTMGNGIAHVFAQFGWSVTLIDVSQSALDKATLEAYVRHVFVWGPQIKVDIAAPKPSPIPGLYEVVFGTHAAFVSADGRYLLMGDLIEIEGRRNLTAARRGFYRFDSTTFSAAASLIPSRFSTSMSRS